MTTSTRSELRELQARAYGPSADIHLDPVAVRRLRELESMDALMRSRTQLTALDLDTAEPAIEDAPVAQHPVPVNNVSETVPDATEGMRATRAKRVLLWAGSVIATAALSAFITHAATSFAPVSASSGVPQTDTLRHSFATVVPAGFFEATADASVFDFHGVTLFTSLTGARRPGVADADCLVAVPTAKIPDPNSFDSSAWGFDGWTYSGCAAGTFPATVEIPFDDEVPDELRAAFPDARAVQFVLDGDHLGVFVDSE